LPWPCSRPWPRHLSAKSSMAPSPLGQAFHGPEPSKGLPTLKVHQEALEFTLIDLVNRVYVGLQSQ
ncbi:13344_t:CDS:1, partial [Funneliformis mosseae]